jgi:hypothetical protein
VLGDALPAAADRAQLSVAIEERPRAKRPANPLRNRNLQLVDGDLGLPEIALPACAFRLPRDRFRLPRATRDR